MAGDAYTETKKARNIAEPRSPNAEITSIQGNKAYADIFSVLGAGSYASVQGMRSRGYCRCRQPSQIVILQPV